LFFSRQASGDSNWQRPQPIAELNSDYPEYEPKLTRDGLGICFVSLRPGGKGGPDIWLSSRVSPDAKWSAPTPMVRLNSSHLDAGPFLTADTLAVFFHSNRPGGRGSDDIWMASRPDLASDFSSPVNVAELNTAALECMPFLSADELTIFFGSNRPGGLGELDIWYSTRRSNRSSWSTPVNFRAVNTEYREFSPALSADEQAFLFERTSPDGLGGKDIYVYSRH
jgi:hypothetical protein